jgi:hypothetical protein
MDKLELEEILEDLFPNFVLRKDNKGKIIIYTNSIEDDDGQIVSAEEFEESEFDEDYVPLVDIEDED